MSKQYIPKGAQSLPYPSHAAVVYLYTDKAGQPAAIAYRYANDVPDWHESFANPEARQERIAQWLKVL